MSDYVNNDMQTAFFEDDLANTDWSKLKEEVMSEPWLQFDYINWNAWDQGTRDHAQAVVPGNGTATNRILKTFANSSGPIIPLGMESCDLETAVGSEASPSPNQASKALGILPLVDGHSKPTEFDESFVCGVQGCKSQPFKRRGDLNRHQRTHAPRQRYDCPAQDCNRYGVRGFGRKDKLNDHILTGHNDNDIFICAESSCGQYLTRDLFSIHSGIYHRDLLNRYRTCPLPRCSFKVYWTRLDDLQNHIQNTHDLKGRARYADVLLRKGYDFQTCKILCPMCPDGVQFNSHGEFEEHFRPSHTPEFVCRLHTDPPCLNQLCDGRDTVGYSRQFTYYLDNLRQQRRTILSLYPEFSLCNDFISSSCFQDIKCR